ncbi:MAG: DUF3843 family protein [Muribaculaceae bacterium]|nr:DUF3843 family protein [Muribaculaceae bacterium]
MKEIVSEQQFLLRQPCFPKKTPTDRYFFRLTNRLGDILRKNELLGGWPDNVIGRALLGVTGYFQDILTDSGIFRSFTEQHRKMYGRWLPFYDTSEDEGYIPHELNLQDVRFLLWYSLAMNFEERRLWNPLSEDILRAAEVIHKELNRLYDDPETPVPEDYHISRGLELGNPEEADEVFHFGNWLFMHCYLMTPAYAMTLVEMMQDPELQGGANTDLLRITLERSMMEDPTGPLALYLREWLFLILKGEMPPEQPESESVSLHPYYEKVIAATGGSPIAFFPTYNELNRFFIDVLGWEETENLPVLKESRDFVILVNPRKGMLVARNVAACLKFPDNPCYNEEIAKKYSIDLLTERGRCPADLLHYAFEHNALCEARFPGNDDTRLVRDNRDFIARCYLQKYYRGD